MDDERILSYMIYRKVLGCKKSTYSFSEFCGEHDIQFKYITRENKNSELFEGSISKYKLSFFGKRMPLIPDDFDALNDKNLVSVTKLLNPEATYTVWREIFILRLLNTLLLNHISPHFPMFYGNHYSYDSDVYADGLPRPYIILLQEKMDDDLKTWALKENRSDQEWLSCLLQIFFALGSLQRYTGVSHMDMHWGNVLVKKLSSPRTWSYKVSEQQSFCLKDQPFLFTICDFGCAQFDTRDEMKDFRRLALNVFKWLNVKPGETVAKFLSEIHSLRNRTWKSVLDLVISRYMCTVAEGEIYDMTRDKIEFFAEEKKVL